MSTRPRPRVGTLTIATGIALAAPLLPLLRVVSPGGWIAGALAMIVFTLVVGYLARTLRAPAVVVTLAEAATASGILLFTINAQFGALPPVTAIPTFVGELVSAARGEIVQGVAPVAPAGALTLCIVAIVGLLTVIIDHVIVTSRLPLMAGAVLIALWLIPSLVLPAAVDPFSFVVMAAALLFLLRTETRTRAVAAPRVAPLGTRKPLTIAAAAVGSLSVLAALAWGQMAPITPGGGTGSQTVVSIDPSLDLGNDLRRPGDVPVLNIRSSGAYPYLRTATLTAFDGDVWHPDGANQGLPLGSTTFDDPPIDSDIAQKKTSVEIWITHLATSWLPVPYAAQSVSGLTGSWHIVGSNRTVVGSDATSLGQHYEVVATVAEPTHDQIRAAHADPNAVAAAASVVPTGTSPIVAELAHRVTGDAATDYDKLIALQDWFRGPTFTYSLTAPAAQGFDSTGTGAVGKFLVARTGYCAHFSAAFALMARSLGMPARIVVGYLPGVSTGQTVDGEPVATVSSGQLHAWPEVFFAGIGWVPFEPTKSLGTATNFAPDAARPTETATPTATTGASPTPSARPSEALATPVASGAPQPSDAQHPQGNVGTVLRAIGGILLAAVIVSAPLLAGLIRRRMLLARARGGDANAAWAVVENTARDVGVPLSAAESPRATGARFVAAHGAPPEAMRRLVLAVERTRYAPASAVAAASEATSVSVEEDAIAIRNGMRSGITPLRRVGTALWPRSTMWR